MICPMCKEETEVEVESPESLLECEECGESGLSCCIEGGLCPDCSDAIDVEEEDDEDEEDDDDDADADDDDDDDDE